MPDLANPCYLLLHGVDDFGDDGNVHTCENTFFCTWMTHFRPSTPHAIILLSCLTLFRVPSPFYSIVRQAQHQLHFLSHSKTSNRNSTNKLTPFSSQFLILNGWRFSTVNHDLSINWFLMATQRANQSAKPERALKTELEDGVRLFVLFC